MPLIKRVQRGARCLQRNPIRRDRYERDVSRGKRLFEFRVARGEKLIGGNIARAAVRAHDEIARDLSRLPSDLPLLPDDIGGNLAFAVDGGATACAIGDERLDILAKADVPRWHRTRAREERQKRTAERWIGQDAALFGLACRDRTFEPCRFEIGIVRQGKVDHLRH